VCKRAPAARQPCLQHARARRRACNPNPTLLRASDLKPENFLLADQSDRAELKATDFGLSAFFRPGQVFSEILGSAYYIAPEVRGPSVRSVWSG